MSWIKFEIRIWLFCWSFQSDSFAKLCTFMKGVLSFLCSWFKRMRLWCFRVAFLSWPFLFQWLCWFQLEFVRFPKDYRPFKFFWWTRQDPSLEDPNIHSSFACNLEEERQLRSWKLQHLESDTKSICFNLEVFLEVNLDLDQLVTELAWSGP